MPKNVRNFWIDLNVDGRQNIIGTGPKSRDGGLKLTLCQRNEGCVDKVLEINCYCGSDGQLHTRVGGEEGLVVYGVTTDRDKPTLNRKDRAMVGKVMGKGTTTDERERGYSILASIKRELGRLPYDKQKKFLDCIVAELL